MKKFYVIAAILLIVVSCIMFTTGHNKLTVYYNSENYPSLNKNAYVGGDAYNYIINAGQATAYFVLGVGGVISALICLACGHLCSLKESLRQCTQLSQGTNDLTPKSLPENPSPAFSQAPIDNQTQSPSA